MQLARVARATAHARPHALLRGDAHTAARALSTSASSAGQKPPLVYFTTRDRIHGREVLDEYGLVSASAVRSKSVLHDMYVAVSGLFGGEAPAYTSLMNEATAEAVQRLQFAAQSLGATAVVNVRFDSNTTMNRLVFGLHCSVIAYGTAVRCRPATLHHHQPAGEPITTPPLSSPEASGGSTAASSLLKQFKLF